MVETKEKDMALNDPETMDEVPPKHLVFVKDENWWLQAVRDKNLYAGPTSDLDAATGLCEVWLTDMNERHFLCSAEPNQWCLFLYNFVAVAEGTPEDVEARLREFFVENSAFEDGYYTTRVVEGIVERGAHKWSETTAEEIRDALEECEGDHDKARRYLLDEAADYYRSNCPF